MRAAVVCLINQQRARHRLPALHVAPLDRSAQVWTNVMVDGRFWHGTSFAARITAVGFIWPDAGENIATGFPTPAGVVGAWMASRGHCQNILDPHYDRVGTRPQPPSGRHTSPAARRPGPRTSRCRCSAARRLGNRRPMNGCPY